MKKYFVRFTYSLFVDSSKQLEDFLFLEIGEENITTIKITEIVNFALTKKYSKLESRVNINPQMNSILQFNLL